MDQYILEVKHDRIAIYGKVPLCQLASVNELARSLGFTELVECNRDDLCGVTWFEFRMPDYPFPWPRKWVSREEAEEMFGTSPKDLCFNVVPTNDYPAPPLESSCTAYQFNQIMEDTK